MKTDEEYKINKLTVCSRRLDRWGLEQLGEKAGPTFVFHSPFSKLLSNKPNAWSRAMNQQINKIKVLIHDQTFVQFPSQLFVFRPLSYGLVAC